VVRADDLLDLTFEFRNLGLRRSGPPALVRVDPAASALVVVGFPPQSVGEGLSQGIEGGIPVPAALSDPSRLAFLVPAAVTEIPFTLDGLLDWSRLMPSLAAEAIGVPPFTATSIEAPWRLVLTTGPRARWVSAHRAVTRGGVTELWHSQLDTRLSEPDRVLRPLWTPELLSPTTMTTALTVGDRENIVNLGGGIPPHSQTPAVARRLELSARGAWLEVDAGWDFPDPAMPPGLEPVDGQEVVDEVERLLRNLEIGALSDDELRDEVDALIREMFVPPGLTEEQRQARRRQVLEAADFADGQAGLLIRELLALMGPRPHFSWSHRMLQGRDDRVRTVTPGFLLPWGFAVDLVRETARDYVSFFNFEAAELVTHASIRVRESARSFSSSQYPFGGRETPFVSCRLAGDTTRSVHPPSDTGSPVWLRTPDDATDLGWTVMCLDRASRPVTVTMPMLFVPLAFAQAPGMAEAAWTTYTSDPRSSVDLGGQRVTLTDGDLRGTTALEVHTMDFGGATQSVSSAAPRPRSAEVSVSAVNALLGTAGAAARVPFTFHDAYLTAGFDAVHNPSQVFADLRKTLEDGAKVASIDIASLPERAGGLMRPELAVEGLSKLVGPVPDLQRVVEGVLDPRKFLPDVKILGLISLSEVVASITSGLTPGDLGALTDLDPPALWRKLQDQEVRLPMPALTSRKIGPVDAPTAVETRFVWKPDLDLHKVLPGGLVLDRAARLVVLSTLHAPLDGSTPSFESTGVLANFAIHFADVVKVQLETLTFVARAGRKLELDAKGVKLTFEGGLAFVERIRDYIPPQGFSDPPSVAVTPTGITAGYSLGLPTIGVGVFSMENVALLAALELPFVDGPTRLRFQLSERHDPFLVTVSLFGGGGFLGITVEAGGAVGVEGALEFGGNFCLDLVVASGGVHVMAGIYFKMAGTVELSGYLRVGGAVTVLGVITVSVEFYLALTYIHDSGRPPLNKVAGDAVLTVGVDVLFLHQDVTLHVHREFANPAGDPTFEDLVSLEAWTTYCDAYAA
jgi:hypothetical protein